MSTQTLEDLYKEGLSIIIDNRLHQYPAPDDSLQHDEMNEYQQYIHDSYYTVCIAMENDDKVNQWSNSVIECLKTYPDAMKLIMEFTSDYSNTPEIAKFLRRVRYVEKVLSQYPSLGVAYSVELYENHLIIVLSNKKYIYHTFKDSRLLQPINLLLSKGCIDKSDLIKLDKRTNNDPKQVFKQVLSKECSDLVFDTSKRAKLCIKQNGKLHKEDIERLDKYLKVL